MPTPLRVVIAEPIDLPFVKRMLGYVTLTEFEITEVMATFARKRAIAKRRDVILEGFETLKLQIVVSGIATRYKTLANGKRQVLRIVVPGDVVGMPSAFFATSRYSVTAITDLVVATAALQDVLDLCHRLPRFAIGMLWFSEMELVHYADRIIDVGRRSPLERVARFLLELHARLYSAGCAAEDEFEMPLSQEIIGDLLGLSAPHVNCMLRQLAAERLIGVDRHRVALQGREGLQLLAQFETVSPPGFANGRL